MANAGLVSFIVVDEHKAVAWEPVFENVKLYRDIAVRTGGETGWAFRKNSPKLKEMINRFVADLPGTGVIFTHSHIDHFGGAKEVADPKQLAGRATAGRHRAARR